MTLVVLSDLANSSPFSVGASTQVALVIAKVRWVFFCINIALSVFDFGYKFKDSWNIESYVKVKVFVIDLEVFINRRIHDHFRDKWSQGLKEDPWSFWRKNGHMDYRLVWRHRDLETNRDKDLFLMETWSYIGDNF
jgi:hypothetical protein